MAGKLEPLLIDILKMLEECFPNGSFFCKGTENEKDC